MTLRLFVFSFSWPQFAFSELFDFSFFWSLFDFLGTFSGLFGTFRDFSGLFGTFRDFSGLFGTFRDFSGHFGTFRDFRLFGTSRLFDFSRFWSFSACARAQPLAITASMGGRPIFNLQEQRLHTGLESVTCLVRWRLNGSFQKSGPWVRLRGLAEGARKRERSSFSG